MHLEVVLPSQCVREVTDRAGIERYGRATPGTDEMMAVNRRAGHVDGASRTIQNPG